MDLDKRVRMAAESILENESLREGLEDEAASALMDWGMACAEQIAHATARLEDETDAEEAMYPRMRALRQLLLAVTGLVHDGADAAQRDQYAQELGGLAAQVYGSQTPPGTAADWQAFMAAQSGAPAQNINELRALIEKKISIIQGE